MTREHEQAITTLMRIRKPDGRFEDQKYRLLFAMALDAAGRTEEAGSEYETLEKSFVGDEARYRYGVFLKKKGDVQKAREIFEAILKKHQQSAPAYCAENRKWKDLVEKELKEPEQK